MSAAAMQERDYYPGTTTEIKVREPEIAAASDEDSLFAKPRDRYTVNGRPFECFAIGVLAKALDDRRPVTIRLWESQGFIPKANFRAPTRQGEGKARLYTREQIEGIVAIAKEEGIFSRDSKKSIKDTNFTKRVVELFQQLEAREYGDGA